MTLRANGLAFNEWLPSTVTYGEQYRPFIPPPEPESPNRLLNPGFDVDLHDWTVYGGGISWDVPGRTAPGSCRMDGDGTYNRDLISNTMPVAQGDVVICAIYIGFAGFDSHGQSPVHLAGVTTLAGTAVDFPVIQAVAPDGDSGAQLYQLKGTFFVPADVDGFAMRLSMRDVATGTVWWDDGEMYKNFEP